jgi:hypothetical protein
MIFNSLTLGHHAQDSKGPNLPTLQACQATVERTLNRDETAVLKEKFPHQEKKPFQERACDIESRRICRSKKRST